jgi:hypothetical protein
MQVLLEDTQKMYSDIMAFYGEDPLDDSARRDFFAKLATFVQEWKVSYIMASRIMFTFANNDFRDPKKRTPYSKTRIAEMKNPCAEKPTLKTSTRSPQPPSPPTPMLPRVQPVPAPWTIYSRNCAPRSPKPKISAIDAGVLA